MLTAILLASIIAGSPKVYDSGSTVLVQEKSVVMSRDDFKYAVTGLVDRSSLSSIAGIQDSLVASLRKSNNTCSLEVASKGAAIKATEDRLTLAEKKTSIVRDSAKAAVSDSYWSGVRGGILATILAEAVIILAAWGHSAL